MEEYKLYYYGEGKLYKQGRGKTGVHAHSHKTLAEAEEKVLKLQEKFKNHPQYVIVLSRGPYDSEIVKIF